MNTGVGGHYHSFKTTVTALSTLIDPEIYVIGDLMPKIFENFTIPVNLTSVAELKKNKTKIIAQKLPIHCFDIPSQIVIHYLFSINAILTICGGKNPIYLPSASNYILYSEENYQYLQNIKKKKKSSLHLIPNRINYDEVIASKNEKIASNEFDEIKALKIMRISRISYYYEKSLLDSVTLVDKLNDNGINAVLILIGKIEDKAVFNKLDSSKNILMKVEKQHYLNAKRYLKFADVIIGTGRSFMEAAAFNKILLAPAKNLSIPVLVTNKNINTFFKYNFSERTIIDERDDNVMNEIIKILNDEELATKIINEIKNFSARNFDIYTVLNDYFELYSNYKLEYIGVINILKSMLFFVRLISLRLLKFRIKKIFDKN